MLQTIIKDICVIHAAILLQILDILENISSIFLLSETGIRTCVLASLVQAQAAYSPTPYPYGFFGKLLASLASFFLDDDVVGAPIRCQR